MRNQANTGRRGASLQRQSTQRVPRGKQVVHPTPDRHGPNSGPSCCSLLELAVFTAINPNFLSPQNISNTLAFTVELGLIALAMTLLMTSGEFDLSVGSLFGFSPVLMWTLFNAGVTSLEVGFRRRARRRRLHRPRQRLVRDAAENPVLPGDARHAARRARHGALHHRRLPAADLERGGQLARRGAGRRLLHRAVPHLHVAVLVHRWPSSRSATC